MTVSVTVTEFGMEGNIKVNLNLRNWDERDGRPRGHLLRTSSEPGINGGDSLLNVDAAK